MMFLVAYTVCMKSKLSCLFVKESAYVEVWAIWSICVGTQMWVLSVCVCECSCVCLCARVCVCVFWEASSRAGGWEATQCVLVSSREEPRAPTPSANYPNICPAPELLTSRASDRAPNDTGYDSAPPPLTPPSPPPPSSPLSLSISLLLLLLLLVDVCEH